MNRLSPSLSALCLALATLPALAQQSSADDSSVDAPNTVSINSLRDPEWKSYQQMLKGVDAYEAGRALAPQAPLRFSLQGEEAQLAGVTLRVVGDSVSIPVPIAPDHTFALPRNNVAAAEEAELVLNRKRNAVRWRTEIHSPDVPDHARRLGDLRLSCAINWAILQDDVGFFTRHAVNLVGACNSRLVKFYWPTAQTIASATLVEGGRRQPLTLRRDGSGYTAPLSDTSWSNEALVLLVDVAPPAPPPAPAVPLPETTPAPAAEPAPLVAVPAAMPAPAATPAPQ